MAGSGIPRSVYGIKTIKKKLRGIPMKTWQNKGRGALGRRGKKWCNELRVARGQRKTIQLNHPSHTRKDIEVQGLQYNASPITDI